MVQLGLKIQLALTLCMLSVKTFSYFCFNIFKFLLFPSKMLQIYNLSIKQFESQVRPHILWGLIWIQIVCKGHQWSLKFTASKQRVESWINNCVRIANITHLIKHMNEASIHFQNNDLSLNTNTVINQQQHSSHQIKTYLHFFTLA